MLYKSWTHQKCSNLQIQMLRQCPLLLERQDTACVALRASATQTTNACSASHKTSADLTHYKKYKRTSTKRGIDDCVRNPHEHDAQQNEIRSKPIAKMLVRRNPRRQHQNSIGSGDVSLPSVAQVDASENLRAPFDAFKSLHDEIFG